MHSALVRAIISAKIRDHGSISHKKMCITVRPGWWTPQSLLFRWSMSSVPLPRWLRSSHSQTKLKYFLSCWQGVPLAPEWSGSHWRHRVLSARSQQKWCQARHLQDSNQFQDFLLSTTFQRHINISSNYLKFPVLPETVLRNYSPFSTEKRDDAFYAFYKFISRKQVRKCLTTIFDETSRFASVRSAWLTSRCIMIIFFHFSWLCHQDRRWPKSGGR